MKSFLPTPCPGVLITHQRAMETLFQITSLTKAKKACPLFKVFQSVPATIQFSIVTWGRLTTQVDLNAYPSASLILANRKSHSYYNDYVDLTDKGLADCLDLRPADPKLHICAYVPQKFAEPPKGRTFGDLEVWWSDAPRIDIKEVWEHYTVPITSAPLHILNSKGNLITGFFLEGLLPKSSPLPAKIPELHAFSTPDVHKLIQWGTEGTLYSVKEMFSDNDILYKAASLLSTTVLPSTFSERDFPDYKVYGYTNLTREQILASPDIWGEVHKIDSNLLDLLAIALNVNNTAALQTALATALLTQNATS